MTKRVLLATFDTEDGLLAGVQAARARGVAIHDVYAPYPVHGLNEALALAPSRLPRICLAGAVAGTALMTYFIYWTSSITWPLNIGGKPWNSLPAFLPPIFETMVLSAAISTVVAFLVRCHLMPGRAPWPAVAGATDHRFVLALTPDTPLDSEHALRDWLAPLSVRHVARAPVGPSRRHLRGTARMTNRRTFNVVLLGALAIVVGIIELETTRTQLRPFEYFPDMARSPRYNTFSPNPNFADGKTLQAPLPGTIALERVPGSPRAAMPDDPAPDAGAGTVNPFQADDRAALARGRTAYLTFCQPCHGETALGDGLVVARGYPRPPDLVHGSAAASSDADLFQAITFGAPDMPPYAAQVSKADRWRIILYLRSLQGGPVPLPSANKTQ